MKAGKDTYINIGRQAVIQAIILTDIVRQSGVNFQNFKLVQLIIPLTFIYV